MARHAYSPPGLLFPFPFFGASAAGMDAGTFFAGIGAFTSVHHATRRACSAFAFSDISVARFFVSPISLRRV